MSCKIRRMGRILALATDYDGTLASEGTVRPQTWQALERLRASGRRVILVTGRRLDDLARVCRRLDLFDRVVAENGGVLYRPGSDEQSLLAAAAPAELTARLRQRGVPFQAGRVVVEMLGSHRATALEVLRELRLEWHLESNLGSPLLLPAGVDKQSGLAAALAELGLSTADTVAIGDAENDCCMLAACGTAVAVANALEVVKDCADLVVRGERGEGVEELIDVLLADSGSLLVK